jgi:hypothetical protein
VSIDKGFKKVKSIRSQEKVLEESSKEVGREFIISS